MRKIKLMPLVILLSTCIIQGCTLNNNNVDIEDIPEYTNLKVISVNDYHGIVDPNGSYPGINTFFSNIKNEYDKDPGHTIVVAAGDMFQGSGVSSLLNGKVILDAMNASNFSAMSLGNHDFDWGSDIIKSAHDGKNLDFIYDKETNEITQHANPEASFPYLGCNIYYGKGTSSKDDDELASDLCQPYTIVTKDNIKVGIIGYIGESQYYSIVSTVRAPFSFHDPVPEVANYAKTLREKENCDVVIAVGHDGTSDKDVMDSNSEDILALEGSSRVDLVFNGHTHTNYIKKSSDGRYNIQAGSYGNAYSVVSLVYNNKQKTLDHTMSDATNVSSSKFSNISNSIFSKIVNDANNATEPILNRVIGYTNTQVKSSNRNAIATWTADCIREKSGCDFGFVNYGGIRTSGFPFSGEITLNTLYGIMPFDNLIVTFKLPGAKIYNLLQQEAITVDITHKNSNLSLQKDNTIYTVCADEYSFGNYIEKLNPTDVDYTPNLVRDAMIEEIEYQYSKSQSWNFNTAATFKD